jgi:hypothetical protein
MGKKSLCGLRNARALCQRANIQGAGMFGADHLERTFFSESGYWGTPGAAGREGRRLALVVTVALIATGVLLASNLANGLK